MSDAVEKVPTGDTRKLQCVESVRAAWRASRRSTTVFVKRPGRDDLMAYLLTHFWPGGTEEQYRATLAVVHPPNGLPAGQIHHAAGPTEGGFLIAAVWDSKESSARFVRDTLLASMPVEGGFEGQPDERSAEISNLETG